MLSIQQMKIFIDRKIPKAQIQSKLENFAVQEEVMMDNDKYKCWKVKEEFM